MNEPLHNLSALDLNKAFIEGEIRAVDIAAYFLDRIQRHNKALGAFLSILEERAILQAEALDRKRSQNKPLGKLAGIPIAIKDNMHIDGRDHNLRLEIFKKLPRSIQCHSRSSAGTGRRAHSRQNKPR